MKRGRSFPLLTLMVGAVLPTSPGRRLEGQATGEPWRLSARMALMNPGVELDRWFVTDEGYHVHPASEDFTPGLELGAVYGISPWLGLEMDLLYGSAPVYLGIVDQSSALEPSARGRMGFLAVLAGPNLVLPLGNRSTLTLGPRAGAAWTRRTSVQATLGPTVDFGGDLQMVYGAAAGLDTRLGSGPVSLGARATVLSMDLQLSESTSGQEASKPFGPVGLLLGISYLCR